jgi:hypothetical protein
VTEPSPQYAEMLDLAHDELLRLVRRLQTLSESAWRSRREVVVFAADRFVELAAQAEGHVVRPLPDVASFALADVVAVTCGDVLAAITREPNADVLAAVLAEVRAALVATR